MNVVCLVGRLTANPELKQTPNSISVTSFSVAITSSNKNVDGSYKTNFINCVAWRNTAEFINKYFVKGQMIGISGSIQTRQYVDRETGKNRTAFEVIVNSTYFVESKPKGENGAFTAETARTPIDDFSNVVGNDDDDLPF